jgi:hypothetical protein
VLRLVAALTLAAFTLLVSVDKVCCPDGCTEQSGQATATESMPHGVVHTCVLCVGVETPGAEFSLTSLAEMSLVAFEVPEWLPVRSPLPPDHPPRNA